MQLLQPSLRVGSQNNRSVHETCSNIIEIAISDATKQCNKAWSKKKKKGKKYVFQSGSIALLSSARCTSQPRGSVALPNFRRTRQSRLGSARTEASRVVHLRTPFLFFIFTRGRKPISEFSLGRIRVSFGRASKRVFARPRDGPWLLPRRPGVNPTTPVVSHAAAWNLRGNLVWSRWIISAPPLHSSLSLSLCLSWPSIIIPSKCGVQSGDTP